MKSKTYYQMTAAELAEATKQYDKPFAALSESKPLAAKMRRMHQRARKRGHSSVRDGTVKLYISMERRLLKQADRFARTHGLSRSQLIAQGIRAVVGFAA